MMNNGNGNHMSAWGYGLMSFAMLVVTGLVIVGVVLVVRHLSGGGRRAAASAAGPEQVLAQRYARGEIDADQYRTRMDTLAGVGGTDGHNGAAGSR